jgi:hypothetical protein
MKRNPRIEFDDEYTIRIKDLPFPISVNESLQPSRGRLIKTQKARDFENEIKVYFSRLQNSELINAKLKLKAWASMVTQGNMIRPRSEIHLDCPAEKLWTKKETVKTFDHCNREKALHDLVLSRLNFDDSLLFSTLIYKKENHDLAKGEERCHLTIWI